MGRGSPPPPLHRALHAPALPNHNHFYLFRPPRAPYPARVHLAALCRSIFIQVEQTPNPDSIKFVPEGKIVLPEEFGAGLVRGGRWGRGRGMTGMT